MSFNIQQFHQELLGWYDAHARVLPWRDDPSPYRVWVSEIMLQQTRVEAVKPYFQRFIKALPSVHDLVEVNQQQLMKLWEGLGYYRRVSNMKRAAEMIMTHYDGIVPSSYDQLINLPGIGPYTAGAIASIAFGERVAAIDGNVLRVMARVWALEQDISGVKRYTEREIPAILPKSRVGDFNQALMELGAVVCLPNALHKCDECPLADLCIGRTRGIAAQLPIRQPRKKRKVEEKTVFLLMCHDRIALRQRPDTGLLAGMWELPNVPVILSLQQCKQELEQWGISVQNMIPLHRVKHIFTHVEWRMIGYRVDVKDCTDNHDLVWVTLSQLSQQYALPSAFKKFVEPLNE